MTIVDNLSRRRIDEELGVESLTPIRPIEERLEVWRELTGRSIDYVYLDLAQDYDGLLACLIERRPDAVVHFAEQRAAPYSMRDSRAKRYTVDNNVSGTHNLLCGIVESGLDIAIVHLGTMGVYGYGWSGSAPIPEGYLSVQVATPTGDLEREILHPANPGSIYHMTKTLDQLMFAFYAKNDGLRITDLHQGIVWGTQTPADGTRRAPDQPLRLRRRLRHRPQPVHHAGGPRPPADRARNRRADPGVHPHPRHGAVRRDRADPPPGCGATGRRCSTRSPRRTGSGTWPSWCPDSPARRSPTCRTPARRRPENELIGHQRPLPRPRAGADHALPGPRRGDAGDRPEVRLACRRDQDHRPVGVDRRDGDVTRPDGAGADRHRSRLSPSRAAGPVARPLVRPTSVADVPSSTAGRWSGRPDLNRGPPAPKAGALPSCATPRRPVACRPRAATPSVGHGGRCPTTTRHADSVTPMPTVRVAVFDLGSSSFHLMVVDASRDGRLEPVLRRRSFLHLGTEVARTGDVPGDRSALAVRTVKRLHMAAEDAGADVVVALATAALRDAGNGMRLLGRMERILGSPITLLTRRGGGTTVLPRPAGGRLGRRPAGPRTRPRWREPGGRHRDRRLGHGGDQRGPGHGPHPGRAGHG